ncbi:MAG: bifunctional (p)ppGpp synthetase/guanosine-3',5'-bis(diphosphate) 3'-pyrophosphohydrolase [Gammaproteobacteria bacterium]|nr:MAG: bifunctional (p)ppGpp synthetase/guanosine-3',5'-bis(diphosphate) 3'-pyrophosphohydrolase [Gammaproteobacteria bacterium]
MVKAYDEVPRERAGNVAIDEWVRALCIEHGELNSDDISNACHFVHELPRGVTHLDNGVALAQLVAALKMDTTSVLAALVYRPLREQVVSEENIARQLGSQTAHLAGAVSRMATTSLLEMSNTAMQTSEARDQVENVRRMLVSLIDDARVAVLKLAERVIALRAAKSAPLERKKRIAQEVNLIFAPLANRLGIWRLKWELEDLALRYLQPDVYMQIAKQLDGRRTQREAQVEEIVSLIEAKLSKAGIAAMVSGRAKNIFSIWRKMRAKNIGLDEVYDVRAFRVMVSDIAQCYATLGVIHTQWQHIPSEFDDYIAVPKENGYRSIHTAVMGADGRTLEVQIRTHEMHEESELGVCAHWSYKDTSNEDKPYTEKMNWLRQVVEWHEETQEFALGGGDVLNEELRNRIQEERIFVYTPKGHVLDLTTGATPLDFAYRVHTEIGHRCRGARVDGETVGLNIPLATGQRVEILTTEQQQPLRSWLEPYLGYVRTARAREKIQSWFRGEGYERSLSAGENLLLELTDRLGLDFPNPKELQMVAENLGCESADRFLYAYGVGDCHSLDVVDAMFPSYGNVYQLDLLALVDDDKVQSRHTYKVELTAVDRAGLLRDITVTLSDLHAPLVSNTGRIDPLTGRAEIGLELQLQNLHGLAKIIEHLRHIDGVLGARRIVTGDGNFWPGSS